MGRVPKGPRFKALATRLEEECLALGHPLRSGAAAGFLEEDVVALAERMRISEAHALRTYFEDWAAARAGQIASMLDQHAVEAATAPSALLPRSSIERLLSGLGQAVLFAGQNYGYANDDECSWVVVDGGDAICGLALALVEHPGRDTVPVAGSILGKVVEVLDRFASLLEAGAWEGCRCQSLAHEHPDRSVLATRVRADRGLVTDRST